MKITVVTPAYKRYKDLENLIKSFLLQDYSKSELLIIDDLGSPKIGEVARKWMKKSEKILYHKNGENLGVVTNIRNSFNIAKGDVIVFMGDDDLFIDNHALSLLVKAFTNKKVGSAKASQILFKNGKISQAFPLKKDRNEIIPYEGSEIFENIWFESVSFTGLAFRNNNKVKELISESVTLYPQVELMGLVSLWYEAAEINKHIVGVQSYSSGQLNPIYYNIDGVRTNILEDWVHIYERVKKVSNKDNLTFISRERFLYKLTSFVLYFLPFNSITNGKKETLMFVVKLLRYNKKIIFVPFLWISVFVSMFLPKRLISIPLEILKKIRLNHQIDEQTQKKFNSVLAKYY